MIIELLIKIYLYVKDPYEAKYQYLINKLENIRLKKIEWSKGFHWIFKWYAGWLWNNLVQPKETT